MEISLGQIAKILNSPISNDFQDIKINHIEFDSRKLSAGSLFAPLVGKRDGHEFIEDAANNGAVATLVDREHSTNKVSIPYLIVNNIEQALFEISKYCLKKVNPKVIAITGSNGKTTTKDMIYSILSRKYHVWRTKDNFNNEIGIPYTIISMPEKTQILAIEIGIDGFDQMEPISKLLKPDIAIITMIGEAHIEFFKSREAIAKEKLKIAKYMKSNGFLIINGDEPLLEKHVNDLPNQVITFGKTNKNNIYPLDVKTNLDNSTYRTNLTGIETLKIPLIGEYNVINSLSTILAAKKMGLSNQDIKIGLNDLRLTKDRVEWFTGKNGEKILDDAYNSNPTAVEVILNVFKDLKIKKEEKKFVVLGDMLELGDKSKELHSNIASQLPSNVFNKVYLYGSDVEFLYNKLKDIYQDRVEYYPLDHFGELERSVNKEMDNKSYLLIKGSHGLHLERLVQSLTSSE